MRVKVITRVQKGRIDSMACWGVGAESGLRTSSSRGQSLEVSCPEMSPGSLTDNHLYSLEKEAQLT